jgi:hypothetical protein
MLVAGAAPAATVDAPEVERVRSIWTSEFSVNRPSGVAYSTDDKALVVTGTTQSGKTDATRVTTGEDELGTLELPELSNPATLAFDRTGKRLAAVTGGELLTVDSGDLKKRNPGGIRRAIAELLLKDPRGSTFLPSDGAWLVLDGAGSVVRMRSGGGLAGRFSVRNLGGSLRGLAFNPADELLYTANVDQQLLFGLDAQGNLKKTFSYKALEIKDLRALTFAPSTDNTDDPANQHLFIADAGNAQSLGRIVEANLNPGVAPLTFAAAATTEAAALVQTIHTSQFGPPAPDPAGVRYMPTLDSLMISDSEVDEMSPSNGASWGGYQGATLWRTTRTGSVLATGTTWLSYPSGSNFNREPTGVGFNQADNTLYISNDDTDRVNVDKPGPDGKHGTADDIVTFLNVGAFGNTDAEDVEYNEQNGHLLVIDGSNREVYDYNSVNGVFGDGNDTATHFDVQIHGATDPEGIDWDPTRQLLVIADQGTSRLMEIDMATNTLVRTITLTNVPFGNKLIGGMAIAPTSNPNDSPTATDYWVVDRQVDNNENPNENDGKLYELSVSGMGGGGGNAPPTATVTAPAEGATVSGTNVSVTANASDDVGVTQVQFFVDGTSIGTDTNGTNGWSATWNSTTVGNGPHVVSATATDTTSQTGSDSNNVTVNNTPADNPPTVTVTAPAEGATVSGASVSVTANASDDNGVTQVQFFVDGTSIGTDTNGTNGWSATWNSTTVGDGPHVVSATARDTGNQTGSDSNNVTVDNVPADSPPTVTVTAPAEGATVSGPNVSVTANASDNNGVTQVQFFVDGTSIGTDTNGTDGWSATFNSTTVADGTHTVSATATDTASQTGSDSNGITVSNSTSLTRAIAVGNDDVEEQPTTGKMLLTDGDLDIVVDKTPPGPQTVGLRFTNITIPKNATIVSAKIQFKADSANTAAASITIRGQAADNAAAFTTAAFNLTSRPTTSASIVWAPQSWSIVGEVGPRQLTSSFASVLQEIVNRPAWASGNAVVIVFTGTGKRTSVSFNTGYAAVLTVSYTLP